MNAIWKSNLGKLFLGGCGTQLGTATIFVVLAGILLFCSVCAVSNAVMVTVTQKFAALSASATAEAVPAAPGEEAVAAPSEEVEHLRAEIDSLVSQVESLRAREASGPAPSAAPPPPPQPFAIAYQGGMNLRSGPGAGYNRIGVLALGSRVEIVGRNEDSSWWLVSAPEGLGWVSATDVVAYDVNDSLPVLTIPALLSWPDEAAQPAPANAPATDPPAPSAPPVPSGTPTATAAQGRVFVEDTEGYKHLRWELSLPPTSASFSPQGDHIAVTEGIKLYLVRADAWEGQTLMAENGILRPVGGVVWSPDGEYLALVVDKLNCSTCRSVALVRISDGSVFLLRTPANLVGDAPRWTQDGRLLLNVHPGEPADGTTYVYDLTGRGEVASGTFDLSSSHDGQRWFPWRPGRIWRAGVTERPDDYDTD